jgi:hypothetical protein
LRSEGILTWANSLLLIGFLVLSLLVTFSGTSLYARAQETFPDNIFASTSQTQLHELVLKATQENGRTNTVSGFNVDLTNVITVPSGSELAIFTTDSALSINEAKLKTTTDAFIDLAKRSHSSFSLAGHPSGVYTIDVIAQKGTASAAYEGILVLGQEPTDPQTRTIIERQITKEDEDNDDDNGRNCDPSYPGVCIPPHPPDLNCPDISYKNFKVTGSDPHGFDRDNDDIGCDSNEPKPPPDPCLNNPNLLQCIDPCEENPALPECIDPCEENPALPECIDPCEENPELEGCQEPLPPEDPCEENPSLPECEEEEAFVVDEEEGVEDEDDGNGDEDNEDSDSEDGNDEVESGGEDDEGGAEEEEGE